MRLQVAFLDELSDAIWSADHNMRRSLQQCYVVSHTGSLSDRDRLEVHLLSNLVKEVGDVHRLIAALLHDDGLDVRGSHIRVDLLEEADSVRDRRHLGDV